MARQVLTKTAGTSPWPTAGVALTETAEDTTNHSRALYGPNDIYIIHNTDASPQTYTLSSVAYHGRTGNITTESIAAGAIHVVGPLASLGWEQSDGYVYFDASDPTVKFAVYASQGRATE